jgi:hypothetical protein
MDYGSAVDYVNSLIGKLKTALPGRAITDRNARLTGTDLLRLWTQFGDRATEFPQYVPTAQPDQIIPKAGEGGGYVLIPGTPAGYYPYSPGTGMGALPGSIAYGSPGCNYEGAGLPLPGQNLGTISTVWRALMTSPASAPAVAPVPTAAPAHDSTARPDSIAGPIDEVVRRGAEQSQGR